MNSAHTSHYRPGGPHERAAGCCDGTGGSGAGSACGRHGAVGGSGEAEVRSSVEAHAREVMHVWREHPVPLIAIDGQTGAGKSTLATQLCTSLPRATVLHVDAIVPGWEGLSEGVNRLAGLIHSWSTGRAGVIETYQWSTHSSGGQLTVPAPETSSPCILEGCGALAACSRSGWDPAQMLSVWVEAPQQLRYQRIDRRDDFSWDIAAWEEQCRAVEEEWRAAQAQWPQVRVVTS